MTDDNLLNMRDFRLAFQTPGGPAEAISGIDLTLKRGEILGLVGESGSGKSVTMMGLMGLLPKGVLIGGSAAFKGEELVHAPAKRMRQLRGKEIGMIFQDPLTAFNPVLRVGDQIVEAMRLHDRGLSKKDARVRAIDLLNEVAIPQPEMRFSQYPHEFSGGMRQRAMIASAIANGPDLLIADEPTTALDVTVQAQIMDVLERLCRERGIGMILITHDLGVVAGSADRIAVMYSGRIVEAGTAQGLFAAPHHPYTNALLSAVPRLVGPRSALQSISGTPPSIINRPSGCAFGPRCPRVTDVCTTAVPPLVDMNETATACFHPCSPEEICSA